MDEWGTVLPRRTATLWLMGGAAALFTVPCLQAAWRAVGESGTAALGAWAVTAVMFLVLLILPLAVLWRTVSRRIHLSPEAVTVTRGDRVVQQLAFAELTQVRVRFSGQGGPALRNENVFLHGHATVGRDVVLVSRFLVASLKPLLRILVAEVERRPELLVTDVDRIYFEHAVATTP